MKILILFPFQEKYWAKNQLTEAGKFNCVKFQIDIRKKKSGTHTKFYEWRTPKIGLVKLEAYIDSKGFIGSIMSILGYDEMKFELKKIG